MGERYLLCRQSELADPASRGFSLQLPDGVLALVLVKFEGRIFAYRNRCPHTGINLEWRADQFFDLTGRYIQCATHGALFRPQDGLCLRGPCAGQSLQPLSLEASREGIYLVV